MSWPCPLDDLPGTGPHRLARGQRKPPLPDGQRRPKGPAAGSVAPGRATSPAALPGGQGSGACRAAGPPARRAASWPSTPGLRAWVQKQLADGVSPEQIAGRLPLEFPDDESHADQSRGDLPGPRRARSRRAARELTRSCAPDGRCASPAGARRPPGADQGQGHDQRATEPRSRTGGARPLGGRPIKGRNGLSSVRHSGRADHPVRAAAAPARRRWCRGRPRRHHRHTNHCRGAAPHPDLGPGHRAGPPRRDHHRRRTCRSTSRRPALPGSEAPTRTPTASCASTWPKGS